MADVRHHADDLAKIAARGSDVAAERAFVGPVPAGEGVVDDGYAGRAFPILRREDAAPQQAARM